MSDIATAAVQPGAEMGFLLSGRFLRGGRIPGLSGRIPRPRLVRPAFATYKPETSSPDISLKHRSRRRRSCLFRLVSKGVSGPSFERKTGQHSRRLCCPEKFTGYAVQVVPRHPSGRGTGVQAAPDTIKARSSTTSETVSVWSESSRFPAANCCSL